MRYFTHYWTNETWKRAASQNFEGGIVAHTASNLFIKRGVGIDDAIYIVTNLRGKLFLCCKIIVGKICEPDEAARDLAMQPEDLWEADWHVIATEPQPAQWNIPVPLALTTNLQFIDGKKIKHLKFELNGEIDKQTLRGIRRLTPDSAMKLDAFLCDLETSKSFTLWESEEAATFEFVSGVEGNQKQRYVTYYERLPQNRAQAIKIHGYDCKGCGFNFEKTYGPLGKDFIHVHHVKPVSQFERPKKINAATDLTVLCPNCHAMVHRKKDKTLSIEELKKFLKIQG